MHKVEIWLSVNVILSLPSRLWFLKDFLFFFIQSQSILSIWKGNFYVQKRKFYGTLHGCNSTLNDSISINGRLESVSPTYLIMSPWQEEKKKNRYTSAVRATTWARSFVFSTLAARLYSVWRINKYIKYSLYLVLYYGMACSSYCAKINWHVSVCVYTECLYGFCLLCEKCKHWKRKSKNKKKSKFSPN